MENSPQIISKPPSKLGWRWLIILVGVFLFIGSVAIIFLRSFLPGDVAFLSGYLYLPDVLSGWLFFIGFVILMVFSRGIFWRLFAILIFLATIWLFVTRDRQEYPPLPLPGDVGIPVLNQ